MSRAIVVTGASGGIGSAILGCLSRAHPDATLIGLDAEPGHTSGAGTAVLQHELDVSDAAAVDAAFAQIAAEHELYALVNAAGVLATGPALDLTAEALARLFAVNALGVIACSVAAARVMIEQGTPAAGLNERSITTVASNAGAVPRAHFAAYGASKAAAAQFTRSLGLELGGHGIRCNVVNPGSTSTPMLSAGWGGQDRSAVTIQGEPALFRAGIPLGRIADASDIAEAVAFLVSPAARHLTLAQLTVDGGASQA